LFIKTKYVAGIAFQLVDDWLDFVSTAEQLGKLLHA
jgi:geranylgeranyl pyrophosphate synthase